MALQFPSPAPPPGWDVTLVRQATTGKFDLSFSASGLNKGNPQLDQTRSHAMLTTLLSWKRGKRPQSKIEEGGYYFDPTGQRGTLLWTITQDRMATRSDLIAAAEDGGDQLANLSYITTFSASAERRTLGSYALTVRWATPSGNWNTSLTF